MSAPNYPTWLGVYEDILIAVNWMVSKANEWGIEPQRIGIIGDSAGAHIGSMLALRTASYSSFTIHACVLVYGVYYATEEVESLMQQLLGGTPQDIPDKHKEASSINYISDAVSRPTFNSSFLIIWGDTDKLVPPFQSEAFAMKLQEKHTEVKTHVVSDQGHFWLNIIPGMEGGTLNDYPNTEVAPIILDFLKEKLRVPKTGKFSPFDVEELKKMKEIPVQSFTENHLWYFSPLGVGRKCPVNCRFIKYVRSKKSDPTF